LIVFFSEQYSTGLVLKESCPSFIKPKRIPIFATDKVATPGMSHFVNYDSVLRFISHYTGWTDEGE
jgi:hypothetical protein